MPKKLKPFIQLFSACCCCTGPLESRFVEVIDGTAAENFGYEMHTNIKALPPKGNTKLIDAYLFDASFEGVPHECPYQDINEMFNLKEIDAALKNS